MPARMHHDEFALDERLVADLVAAQFPDLAGLPVHRVRPAGTVHAVYRLGDRYCARLPLTPAGAAELASESRWLPRLAARLPLGVPEPVGLGRPTPAYPSGWAVYRWIEGRPYTEELVDDEAAAAAALAGFVRELRAIDPAGAAPAGRRPLAELDAGTRAAIAACGDDVDQVAAVHAWELALAGPTWSGSPVWIHADLLRPNLLVDGGRIRAVIDFGAAGRGDPAADVIPAWSVFGQVGRACFRARLDVDDDTWNRARGYALHQAAQIVPYYRDSNPAFAGDARRTIAQVVAEIAATRG
jgi:aminoglycoside phosphotransferase (APT) family kinase protein